MVLLIALCCGVLWACSDKDKSSDEISTDCYATKTETIEKLKKPSEGLAFALQGDDTYQVMGIGTCTDKEVVIPATYEGKAVTSIGSGAFYDCSGLTSATIENGVTSIGASAFSGCRGLTSATIENGVTSIGASAFSGCRGLNSITFEGTKAQWNAIAKGFDWNYNTGNYTVHCTDGDIAK